MLRSDAGIAVASISMSFALMSHVRIAIATVPVERITMPFRKSERTAGARSLAALSSASLSGDGVGSVSPSNTSSRTTSRSASDCVGVISPGAEEIVSPASGKGTED